MQLFELGALGFSSCKSLVLLSHSIMDKKLLPGPRRHIERFIQRLFGVFGVALAILLVILVGVRYSYDSKRDIKTRRGLIHASSFIKDSPQCVVFDAGDTTSRCASSSLGSNLNYLLNPSMPSSSPSYRKNEVLGQLRAATNVVRATYFTREVGTWPGAIDWTAAFTQTVLTAVMRTYVEAGGADGDVPALFVEIVASYYGQDALAIRYEVSIRLCI